MSARWAACRGKCYGAFALRLIQPHSLASGVLCNGAIKNLPQDDKFFTDENLEPLQSESSSKEDGCVEKTFLPINYILIDYFYMLPLQNRAWLEGTTYHSTCWLRCHWTRIRRLTACSQNIFKLAARSTRTLKITHLINSFRRIQQGKHVKWDEKPISFSNYASCLGLTQRPKNLPL